MSGSATSASASRSRRCPAASGSGSSWPPTWPKRAASTSSTSQPPACTSPTSRSCSACSTGSSMPASRSSSSSTTRPSWRTPTGSSTSVPARATTAAGSSSTARPPTSSPPDPLLPASTSRPTSAPDRGSGGQRLPGAVLAARLVLSLTSPPVHEPADPADQRDQQRVLEILHVLADELPAIAQAPSRADQHAVPASTTERREEHKRRQAHVMHAGRDRDQAADNRDDPAEQNRLRPVAHEAAISPVDVVLLEHEPAAVARDGAAESLLAEPCPDAVQPQRAGNRPHGSREHCRRQPEIAPRGKKTGQRQNHL